ncbi:MAG: hypothetical protein V4615_11160 [Bacteroidota bacterium]
MNIVREAFIDYLIYVFPLFVPSLAFVDYWSRAEQMSGLRFLIYLNVFYASAVTSFLLHRRKKKKKN